MLAYWLDWNDNYGSIVLRFVANDKSQVRKEVFFNPLRHATVAGSSGNTG